MCKYGCSLHGTTENVFRAWENVIKLTKTQTYIYINEETWREGEVVSYEETNINNHIGLRAKGLNRLAEELSIKIQSACHFDR